MKLLSAFVLILAACSFCLLISTTVTTAQRTFEPNDAASGPKVDAFWRNVTGEFEASVREQSSAVVRNWNRAVVRGGGGLKGKVSPKCLAVIQRIIRRPLESRWSAQSKLKDLVIFRTFFIIGFYFQSSTR